MLSGATNNTIVKRIVTIRCTGSGYCNVINDSWMVDYRHPYRYYGVFKALVPAHEHYSWEALVPKGIDL